MEYEQDQESLPSLSPCSSCDTIVDLAHAAFGRDQLVSPPAQFPALKILLPNLVDSVSVAQTELDAFVAEHSAVSEATVTHLLIYLFAKKVHPSIRHINDVKLLHVGKSYRVGRQLDLSIQTPLIRDIIDMFPTFQLLIAPEYLGPPISMSIDRMVAQCTTPAAEAPPVTYAEAMVRMFRKRRSLRTSSVETIDSGTAGATRFLSRGSTTDTEEGSASVTTLKIKQKFKKLIRKTRELSISSTPQQYDICL